MSVAVALTVNDRAVEATVPTATMLAEFLRGSLHLQGCRIACDAAVCGACTVLVDGAPTAACSTFVFEVEGSRVETIEGLAAPGTLHPIQAAFLEGDAFQCGFCTAGLILSTKALLARDPHPSEATIREWLGAHLCRCTGYNAIIAAVRKAGEAMT